MENQGLCPICSANGCQSRLKPLQINMEEAIFMCSNKKCTYPLGVQSVSTLLVHRKASETANSRPRRSRFSRSSLSSSRSSSPAQSSIMSPPLPRPRVEKNASLNSSAGERTLANTCTTTAINGSIPATNKCSSSMNDLKHVQVVKENSSLAGIAQGQVKLAKSSSNRAINGKVSKEVGNSNDILPQQSDVKEESPTINIPHDILEMLNCDTVETLDKKTVDNSETNCLNSVSKSVVCDENPYVYIQWRNRYALCWLDVVLCLLVHCSNLNKACSQHQEKDSIVHKLLKTYNMALKLINPGLDSNEMQISRLAYLETSVGTVAVKTGGGDASNVIDGVQTTLENQNAANQHSSKVAVNLASTVMTAKVALGNNNLSEAGQLLEDIRECVWQALHPKLRCRKGDNDSPVFAFPLIIQHGGEEVQKLFEVQYTWVMTCTACGFNHIDRVEKTLPTFPHVPAKFTLSSPYFERDCFLCKSPKQKMQMRITSFPAVLVFHFVEGLAPTCPDLTSGQFEVESMKYQLSGVVQYKNDPDHFVSWIRNSDGCGCSVLK